MAQEIVVKQGESRTISVTLKSSTGTAVNLTSASMWLGVKQSPDDADYLIYKDSQYFDYTGAASGQVSVTLGSNDTLRDAGRYWLEIKAAMSDGTIIKSVADYFLKIKAAVLQPKYVAAAGAASGTAATTGTAAT